MKPTLQEIPLNQIHAKENYRKTFKDRSLAELAASIRENGVIEPIIVRPNENGYEIIAGERRFRASLAAGLATIPAMIRDVNDDQVLKLQIVENVQRENVPFMEEADAVRRLRNELDLDVDEICKMIGKSNSYVYHMLKLTAMPDQAQTICRNGWISKAVAWHIAKLPNDDYQIKAANDLARTQQGKLVTENGAKSYIRDNFQSDSAPNLRKTRIQATGGNEFSANWKKHLVAFNCEQFEAWKGVVRGRTETAVLAEAVDVVMRREKL